MENSHDQPSFVRSTATVSAGTLTSRVLGMVKMSVLSGLFGASDANDAFVAAFKIPNMLRDMFAEGALSAAFIPVFTTRLKLVGRSDSFQTANVVMSFLLVTVGLLVLVGIGLAPEIVSLLAPGFSETPGKFELTVMLGRVMMPFLLVISIAALFMGMLNALGKFGTPAFAPAVLNIGMIACGFILCPILNPPILGMAIGVLIGGTGQCLIQLPQLMKSGFRLRFRLNLWDPDLRQVLMLMAPMVIGLVATQVNVFVITNLASRLSEGAVSYLEYAYRLLHLPLGLFGVAIATVSLPSASRLASEGDMQGLADHLMRTIRLGIFLVLPAQAVLLIGGEPIVALIYQHREFVQVDTVNTTSVLAYYSIGLFAFSGVRIVVPIFYAMKETRIPVLISIVAVITNIILCLLFTEKLSYRGLSLAVALSGWLNLSMLLAVISRRVPLKSSAGGILPIAKAIAPSVVVAAFLLLLRQFYPCDTEHGNKIGWLIYTTGMMLVSALLVFLSGRALRLPELDSLLKIIKR